MTKKRILFHASWMLSCCLLGFAILTQACGEKDDEEPMKRDCETLMTVYNRSGTDCHICKSGESPNETNLISGGVRQWIAKYYTTASDCYSRASDVCNVTIYNTSKNLIWAGMVTPLGPTSYYQWNGTSVVPAK
jgi:hypothetical protein